MGFIKIDSNPIVISWAQYKNNSNQTGTIDLSLKTPTLKVSKTK